MANTRFAGAYCPGRLAHMPSAFGKSRTRDDPMGSTASGVIDDGASARATLSVDASQRRLKQRRQMLILQTANYAAGDIIVWIDTRFREILRAFQTSPLLSPCSNSVNIGRSVWRGKRELVSWCCSLYVLFETPLNPFFQVGRYDRPDCHHGENQPGKRRPRSRWFSLR